MKLLEILRFEFLYQSRRLSTWLFFTILVLIAGMQVRLNFLSDALYDEFYVNSPFVIAVVSVFGTLMWLLAAAPIAGETAARDAQTRMHPLAYTSPINKAQYLGGRFAAAFLLNALILLGIPMGIALAVYLPGVDAEAAGPFRAEAYLTALGYITLPNAFICTAIQFSFAALNRRSKAAYLGSLLLFFTAYALSIMVGMVLGRPDLARLVDPVGIITIVSDLSSTWTPVEKGSRLLELEGTLLINRLLWIGIACLVLVFTYLRFSFVHYAADRRWTRIFRRKTNFRTMAGSGAVRNPGALPHVRRTFGLYTFVRQTVAIFMASFGQLAKGKAGLFLLVAMAGFVILVVPLKMENLGIPLEPRTGYLISFLTAPVTNPLTVWVIIPLLIVFYSGELIWGEREAGMDAVTDTSPVPEWVYFLGKFFGLALILAVWTGLLTIAGILTQVRLGYQDYETGLLVKVMFGLQLPEYLLFALLALFIHVVVNQKATGHLMALVVYALISFGPMMGLEDYLFLFGNGPGWSYSEMRGFGPFIEPWLWFKVYWAAWALLLALGGRLLWVRSKESGLKDRLLLAIRRFNRSAVGILAAGLLLIFTLGGFIFYNTHVMNDFQTSSDRMVQQAAYERLFSRYSGLPQPEMTGIRLHAEIYPGRGEAEIKGSYVLVNTHAVSIEDVHLSTVPGVLTTEVKFDRTIARVFSDVGHGHRIYTLGRALKPGDSLQLSFQVRIRSQGFTNKGVSTSVVQNGTYITNEDWLPSIGYQQNRELVGAAERRSFGLPARPAVPELEEADTRRIAAAGRQIRFEAVVGTDPDQVAITPGALHKSWTKGRRRYFHYITDVPIQNQYAIMSARYALREGIHKGVKIQIFHHPVHTLNLDRMFRSVQASLDYHTRQYGPYPYSYIRLIEEAGKMMGMHAEATHITYGEGFSSMDPGKDRTALDLPFAVVAHEVAHQWWGHQLKPARVAGAPLLSESLAWYSAMGVVAESDGREHLERLRAMMRQPFPIKPIRPAVPLLQAADSYQAYRKGPFALFALSEYVGRERVDVALKNLLQNHLDGGHLATSLDLYRELQKVTPAIHRSLLSDLFEKNTFWEMKTEQASGKQLTAGKWQVTLNFKVEKVVIDNAGIETPVLVNDLIEIGIYSGDKTARPLYLKKHRIRSDQSTITLTVAGKPVRAGIDPNFLLIDQKPADNTREIKLLD